MSQEHSALPVELLKEIDARCRDFETRWQQGAAPVLEDYLNGIAPQGRQTLLRDLLIVEFNYRRDKQGRPPSQQEYCTLHPEFVSHIISYLSERDQDVGTPITKDHFPPTRSGESPAITEIHRPRCGSSRGLHIRCPHCSNPVELLADTSFDSVTCQTCGSAFSLLNENEATKQAPVLKKIGRFEIVGRLGVGGFGTVWKARDSELDRAVAIKIPRKGQLDRDEIDDFLKEARTAAQLHHPRIVPVYEVGREGETVFIVSELVRGVSLSDWLSATTVDFRRTSELLVDVAAAIDHAHTKGVIHRDLKPSNILMDENDRPNVMDFGLAKREGLELAMTVNGQILGTPAYMSPEQAAGKSNWTDCRMDIYSLGVILFRMLTGELPYRGNAQMQIHQRLTRDAPDPRTLNRYIPRDLATICGKCLERDPNSRYSTAKQLAEELERFLRGEPIVARPISRIERTMRWAKRQPALATVGLLTVILAIFGPIVAGIIAHQRSTLSALLTEKDHLIERMGTDRTALASEKTRLQEQLDLWEGRANPWSIWPPKGSAPSQKSLLNELLPSGKALAGRWKASSTGLDLAYGHLALAAMYDELDKPELASAEYSAAQKMLEALYSKQPNNASLALALADCFESLARLTVNKDREKSLKLLNAADRILQGADISADAAVRAGRVTTKLDLAVISGFSQAANDLEAAKKAMEEFARNAPADPSRFYELVCQLANRTPHLLLADPRESGPLPSSVTTESEPKATP